MKKTKGLLITYWFPPVNSVACQRTESMYYHFNQGNNISLDVLCPKWNGVAENISGNGKVYYTHSEDKVMYSRHLKSSSWISRLKEFIIHGLLEFYNFRQLRRGNFYKKGKLKLQEMNLDYDFIIASFGPLDAFFLAKFVKHLKPTVKLIFDYRDLLTLNPIHGYGKWTFLSKYVEKSLLRDVDLISAISPTMLHKALILAQPSAAQVVCYNGINDIDGINNPESNSQIPPSTSVSNKTIWVYAGALYGGKRNLLPLFNYLSNQDIHIDLHLLFILFDENDILYMENLKARFPNLNVEIEVQLPHKEVMKIIDSASAGLLVLTEDGADEEYLPVKMFEYIQFEKPIVFCGNRNKSEAYRVIREFNVGDHFEDMLSSYSQEHSYEFEKAKDYFARKNQCKKLETEILRLFGK